LQIAAQKNGSADLQLLSKELKSPAVVWLGGSVLSLQLYGGVEASGLPRSCITLTALFSITVHLLIFSLILTHFLTFFIGHKFLREEDPNTFFLREYVSLFWVTVIKSIILAIIVWLLCTFLFGLPAVAAWAATNTSIRTSGQLAVPFATLAFLLLLSIAAFRDELFSTVWERLFFFFEVLFLIYEMFYLTMNIDLFVIILSFLFLLQQLTLHISGLPWRHEKPPRLPTRSHESSAR